jgi:hypothetical protein
MIRAIRRPPVPRRVGVAAAVLRLALAVALLPAPHPARAQAPADSVAVAAAGVAEARELIKTGDYDRAIEVLRSEIADHRDRPDVQREAYLQLIKTYVFLGNDYKLRPQGREASNLNYRAARELIAEALAIPALRHMQPEPATDYPPEMIAFFAEVRSKMFGGFRVVGLEPAVAVVLLDGDTLTASGERLPEAADLPVGEHTVAGRAPGYKETTQTITQYPGGTIERNNHTGAAAVVAGSIALIANGENGDGPSPPEPLPGAPPPPP